MLEAVTTNDEKLTVYIGSIDSASKLRTVAAYVMFIYADGDELAYIEATFKNLPSVPMHTGTAYYGDLAKFIAGNWWRS